MEPRKKRLNTALAVLTGGTRTRKGRRSFTGKSSSKVYWGGSFKELKNYSLLVSTHREVKSEQNIKKKASGGRVLISDGAGKNKSEVTLTVKNRMGTENCISFLLRPVLSKSLSGQRLSPKREANEGRD